MKTCFEWREPRSFMQQRHQEVGPSMVFWGNSKVLYQRIARRETYLADAVENNETKQGSNM